MKIRKSTILITALFIILSFTTGCAKQGNIESPNIIEYIDHIKPESSDLSPPSIEISTNIDTYSGIATLTLFAEDTSGIKDILFHVGSEVMFCNESPCIKKVNIYQKNITYYAIAIDNSKNLNSIRYPVEGLLNVELIEKETSGKELEYPDDISSGNGNKRSKNNNDQGSNQEQPSEEYVPTPTNIVTNEGFNSEENWTFYTNGAGDFNVASNPLTDNRASHITISTKGSNTQLYQKDFALESNTVYLLTFEASSPNGTDLDISILKHTTPYTNYGLDTYHINILNGWSNHSVSFRTPETDSIISDARLMFSFSSYADSGDEYWIDNVVLTEYCNECYITPKDDNITIPKNNTKPTNNTTPSNNTKPANNSNNQSPQPTPAENKLPVSSKGKKWVMTFYDEFNGKSINTSKWNGGYSNLPWCPPWSGGIGSCANQYTGLVVSDGTLKLYPTLTPDYSTAYANRAMINTGGPDIKNAKFGQKYGYFEIRAKLPTNKNGEGDGLWSTFWALPFGKDYASQDLGPGLQHEELDITENVGGTKNRNYTFMNLHDYVFGQNSAKYPAVSVGDLSDGFHTYGVYWRNDGSRFGSVQAYFDGKPEGKIITLDSRSSLWDNGVYLIVNIKPCPINNKPHGGGNACTPLTSDDNPFIVDYVRVYKEVS